VLEERPNDSYPLYLAALAAYGDEKHEESLKYIKKAISINPNYSDYYIIRGRAFSGAKQYEEAEKQFQKALSLGFDDIGLVSFYQAQNYLVSKRNEEAIDKFE
jgi:tetratricopeptide (TPR) repeat protein